MKKSTLAMLLAAACMLTSACSDCKSGSCSGENGGNNYETAIINPNAKTDLNYTTNGERTAVDEPINIQWCQTTYVPEEVSLKTGLYAYAQVYANGITGLGGSHDGILAQVGYFQQGAFANAGDEALNYIYWVDAERNVEFSGAPAYDEYMISASPLKAAWGRSRAFFRFSGNGGYSWIYCGTDGIMEFTAESLLKYAKAFSIEFSTADDIIANINKSDRNPKDECQAHIDCPEGFECEESENGVNLCVYPYYPAPGCTSDADCGLSEVCSNGECVKKEEYHCSDGSRKCSSDRNPMFCVDNTWITQGICEAGTTCKFGECTVVEQYVCNDGDTTCTDDFTVGTCKDHEWVESVCPEICSNGACTALPTGAECFTGDKKCSKDNSIMTCVDYKWVEAQACPFACIDGECAEKSEDVCADGSTKCGEDGTLMACVNNAWTVKMICNDTCVDGVCIKKEAECIDGDRKCDGNTLSTCVDGQWTVKQVCATGETCSRFYGICAQCGGNSFECRGKDLYNCRDNVWVLQQTCTDTQICSGSYYGGGCIDTFTPECNNGETKCDANALKTCVSGKWTTKQACGSGEVCRADLGICAQCGGNSYECRGQDLYNCRNSVWVKLETCPDNTVCTGYYYGGGCIID